MHLYCNCNDSEAINTNHTTQQVAHLHYESGGFKRMKVGGGGLVENGCMEK